LAPEREKGDFSGGGGNVGIPVKDTRPLPPKGDQGRNGGRLSVWKKTGRGGKRGTVLAGDKSRKKNLPIQESYYKKKRKKQELRRGAGLAFQRALLTQKRGEGTLCIVR